ncbi:hypothetical protein POVWA2_032610 [Plasmodium ovale wallikeri]|uniref:Uncharacterized protein n=1 Tax=Plasmodium ovale wallikeri TaxID=864142 RepID=A0A1A8YZ28_PLAOA|nr:hypothetical protein POVWA1_032990 [Plasmodium ovale wallikeri]SBT36962.1 hypothetical protein POVWA2_032610 [Plasmodium ovale wallikeri]
MLLHSHVVRFNFQPFSSLRTTTSSFQRALSAPFCGCTLLPYTASALLGVKLRCGYKRICALKRAQKIYYANLAQSEKYMKRELIV